MVSIEDPSQGPERPAAEGGKSGKQRRSHSATTDRFLRRARGEAELSLR